MDMPTLEEFTDGVKGLTKALVGYISDEETEAYIRSDRAKQVIEDRYNRSVRKVEDGKLTAETFRDDVEFSVAYCLALMY